MDKILPGVIVAISAWLPTACGQDLITAGDIFPAPPSSSSQIASRFMFEVRDSQWADNAEERTSEAIGEFDGYSAPGRIICKATICSAWVEVLSVDESAIWRIDAKPAAPIWAPLPYRELADLAGFERVTEHSRRLDEDGTGTVHVFFSSADYRSGFLEAE